MNPLITGNLKSKTSWLGLLLIIIGALDQSGATKELIDLIPEQYRGTALTILGAVVLALRNLTSGSIADKTPPKE